jgi:hypothetical protein
MAKQSVTPNLDPVIYQNGKALANWAGWCLAYVQTAFGAGWAGATAWGAWENLKKKHSNRSFPKNVYFPIWFSHYGDYGYGYGNYGHVAIAYVRNDGQMQIWSSPASAKPYADVYSSIGDIERTYSSSFVGWSEDIGGTTVISNTAEQGGYAVETIKSMYLRLLGRGADQGGIDHYTNQANSKGWDFVYNDLKNSEEGQIDWNRRNPERVSALERAVSDRDRIITELQTALTNEKNKPPVEVIKTVEKIVEKPVEVIKEVPTASDPQMKADISWIRQLLEKIFK